MPTLEEDIKELENTRSPKRRAAAKRIRKRGDDSAGPALLAALHKEVEDSRTWETQCEMIKALGECGYSDAVPFLIELASQEYKATAIYGALGFAICLLSDIPHGRLDYFRATFESTNERLISGACSALLHADVVPTIPDIQWIITAIRDLKVDADEGRVVTPRTYIAALAYAWPPNETREFLESCMKSRWPTLVSIAKSSLSGERSKYTLI